MLCYVMLCYAMLCYAMLCYAMLPNEDDQTNKKAIITVGIVWHVNEITKQNIVLGLRTLL